MRCTYCYGYGETPDGECSQCVSRHVESEDSVSVRLHDQGSYVTLALSDHIDRTHKECNIGPEAAAILGRALTRLGGRGRAGGE